MFDKTPEEEKREEPRVGESSLSRESRVELGQVVATPGALTALREAGVAPADYLYRHGTKDWGEVDPEDWASNDQSLVEGTRLLSAYTLPTQVQLWIITEWDHSVTTLLLPEEY